MKHVGLGAHWTPGGARVNDLKTKRPLSRWMRGGMAVALVAATTMLWGQQNAVVSETSGNRVYLEMSLPALQSNLDTLFARSSQATSLTWSDVLANGGSPGIDLDFNGFSASGIGDLVASVTADSLVLNKDAALLKRRVTQCTCAQRWWRTSKP